MKKIIWNFLKSVAYKNKRHTQKVPQRTEYQMNNKETKDNDSCEGNLLNGAPYSSELNYQTYNDFSFWSKASDTEKVEEIEYIISTYYESGHDNYEALHPDVDGAPLEYRKEAKGAQIERRKELKELKDVLVYAKNKLTKRNKK